MSLDPNRFALPSEATILWTYITEDAQELSLLEPRLQRAETLEHDTALASFAANAAAASAQVMASQLRLQRAVIQARMRLSRSYMHPIRQLPDDVLREVFLNILPDMVLETQETWHDPISGGSLSSALELWPWRLAAVSRRWRQLAQATPTLWANIVVRFNTLSKDHYALARLCRACELFPEQPLTIFVCGTATPAGWLVKDHAAIVQSIVSRAVKIYLTDAYDDEVGYISFNGPTSLLLKQTTACLQHLSLFKTPRMSMPVPLGFIGDTSQLQSLHIEEWNIFWDAIQPILSLKAIHLKLSGLVPCEQLAHIALAAPNVERLTLVFDFIVADGGLPPNIATISFPRARTVHLDAEFDEIVIRFLRLPNVETLNLYREKVELRHTVTMLKGLAPTLPQTLRTIQLGAFWRPADDTLSHALRGYDSLERLELSDVGFKPSFFRAMTTPEGSDWIMPSLRELVLKQACFKTVEQETGEASLIAFVRARRQAATTNASIMQPAVLRRVDITWTTYYVPLAGFEAKLRSILDS
ncbi:hypothetical protein BKA62DRAFT_699976 [Auriculariales sp. MPI-PUGE-AT-0066]|nr:hypothetical protein BKA62DRAFT_699976 [Auriculariales sp. MPI-PUGE-AT-0066]